MQCGYGLIDNRTLHFARCTRSWIFYFSHIGTHLPSRFCGSRRVFCVDRPARLRLNNFKRTTVSKSRHKIDIYTHVLYETQINTPTTLYNNPHAMKRERERERQNIFKTQVDWSLVEILPARIRVFLLSCRIDDDGIPRSSSPLDNHYHPRAPLWTTTTTTNGMHHCGCPLPSIIMPQINYYHGHNNEISRRRCIMSRLTTNHNNHDEGTL